jgi:hypothetical protein
LPRLELLAGRAEDFLRLADGRLVDPRQVWAVLRGQRAIFQYQLTQETWNSFRLRLVAAGDAAELEPKLRTALTNLLGPQASIVVEFVETIPTPARGKLRAVQSLLQEAVSP